MLALGLIGGFAPCNGILDTFVTSYHLDGRPEVPDWNWNRA